MRQPVRYQRVLRGMICTVFVVVLLWSLRRAWTHTESDFPSYYTAAHLVLKREPLRSYYDMARFQERMDSIVIPNRLGGYIPQTPLTMLPFVPLASLPMDNAKQLWLVADIAFLAGTVLVLTRVTRVGISEVLGLFLLGFGSLYTNLMLGQYYVLVLFLLTCAIALLIKKRDFAGGLILGLICSLKLMTAPFLLYFAWRKQPKALVGMCMALVLGVSVAIALFGWADLAFYLGQILPRSLGGETLNPYNPGNGTATTLLRRMLLVDAELNPNPFLNRPPLFFFLQTLFTLSILAISLLRFERTENTIQSYAAFLLALILMSPNTASYTFLLLLLPVALMLGNTTTGYKIVVLLCYTLLAIPMRPSWNWLFPKVWILMGMFWLALMRSKGSHRARPGLGVMATALVLALLVSGFESVVHARETNRRWTPIVDRGAIFSSSPIPIQSGIVYQSILHGRYMLRLHSGDDSRNFELDGDAFNPVLLSRQDLIGFESVRSGRRCELVLDPRTGMVRLQSDTEPKQISDRSRSPDGRWAIRERTSTLATQLYLVDLTRARTPIQLTQGACSSSAAAWERDSQAIVFASDCGRGVGMPALYRAPLKAMLALAKK